MSRFASALLFGWLAWSCSWSPPPECQIPTGAPFDIRRLVSDELLRQANHGRDVLRPDGLFAIPNRVRRVFVDVGAHHMESTKYLLLGDNPENSDAAVIAIEPLAECWGFWPNSRRLIGIPAAIYTERGTRDFNVNAFDTTSSLAKSRAGTAVDDLTRTVQVRTVPVLRLEDVLARVPPRVEITYLKVDVQGLDLQVVKSAGEHLRRVQTIKVEVINANLYEKVGEDRPATEEEMTRFMQGMGFRFVRDSEVVGDRLWLDKEYTNHSCKTNRS